MRRNRWAWTWLLVALLCALGSTGCVTVVSETAKKALEDRSTDDQVIDTKMGVSFLSALADKDANLAVDVSTDVWEQRVLLTGTVSDAKSRQDVLQVVRADRRGKAVYDEIQLVSKEEQARRRNAVKNKNPNKKEGVDRAVNDFWIETKISAQLITASDVTSVNYRWRSVRNTVYIIGRARTKAELTKVLGIIRATDGVAQAKAFVDIKPAPK